MNKACHSVSVMVKRNTVEFLKRIGGLSSRGSETRIHRDPFQFGWVDTSNIDASALLYIAEIARVNTPALMWYHRRLHMANEGPLRWPEEWVRLHIRGASSSTEAFRLILDQEFAN